MAVGEHHDEADRYQGRGSRGGRASAPGRTLLREAKEAQRGREPRVMMCDPFRSDSLDAPARCVDERRSTGWLRAKGSAHARGESEQSPHAYARRMPWVELRADHLMPGGIER